MKLIYFKDYLRKIKYVFNKEFYVGNFFDTDYQKNCLISYIAFPFKKNILFSKSHQNVWQVREIASIISRQGYNVDIIDYDIRQFRFKKKYDLVFDICARDRNVYDDAVKDDAKRILYITGSNPKFSNSAEIRRIEELWERRGIKLSARRQVALFSSKIELFDSVIMLGNNYNFSTFNSFNFRNVYFVNNTGYDFTKKIIYENKSSKNFLFFGSAGCVHKGLDLLLEIFSEQDFPCTLYVGGYFEREKDFVEAYSEELYHKNNIIPIGFLDISSEKFFQIASLCGYTILPSCSEGQAGSVLTCMSAGMIPIVSKECGFDAEDVILLEDCSIEKVREKILMAASLGQAELIKKCHVYQKKAEIKFSQSQFSKAMHYAIEETIHRV